MPWRLHVVNFPKNVASVLHGIVVVHHYAHSTMTYRMLQSVLFGIDRDFVPTRVSAGQAQ